jgi:hypothetical protein
MSESERTIRLVLPLIRLPATSVHTYRSIRIFDRAWNGIKEYKVEVHLRPLLRGDKQTSNVGIKLIKGDWPDIEERLDQLIQQLQLEGWLISEIKQNYPECSMQENPLVASA